MRLSGLSRLIYLLEGDLAGYRKATTGANMSKTIRGSEAKTLAEVGFVVVTAAAAAMVQVRCCWLPEHTYGHPLRVALLPYDLSRSVVSPRLLFSSSLGRFAPIIPSALPVVLAGLSDERWRLWLP